MSDISVLLFLLFKKIVYLAVWILAVTHGTFSCSMWDLVPQAGIELDPWHWACRVLATGPKSLCEISWLQKKPPAVGKLCLKEERE